jgi:sugar phosphate isomerase/epimerase
MRDPLAVDRRAFLQTLAAGLAGTARSQRAPRSALSLAFTSFAVRLKQSREQAGGRAFGAVQMLDLCRRFGARGAQIDVSQLPVGDHAALASIGHAFADDGLELELAIPAEALASEAAYGGAVDIAKRVGARRARVALLDGRRYETFHTRDAWDQFAARWRRTLVGMRHAFDRQQFPIGIENHKDFMATELVDVLRAVGSRYVGACVDFGNNIALLEDPDEIIERLAPFAVTTHIKDMAVFRTARGFDLSEVPLGQGMLPIGNYVRTIRRARPGASLCLEMLTRDPLVVAYETDAYWAPFDATARNPDRIRRFERRVLSRASARALPRIEQLAPNAQMAAEDQNVQASLTYARDVLKLTAS